MSQRSPVSVWWQRNRLPLVALLPLTALALAATSYQLTTFYLPNKYLRPQTATGKSLNYHETFVSGGKTYQRRVTLSLLGLSSRPAEVREVTLWDVHLKLEAAPDVPLASCEVALIDTQGRLYGTGLAGLPQAEQRTFLACTPYDATGPTFDLQGKLLPTDGAVRPPAWEVEATVALPTGQTPRFVRVAWQPPHYALIPVRELR